ncbi:prepilin-type N-terminal cleavage/methylation domain-containing protein [Vibrio sp. ZSDE26]|uniref:Prepilin-type N-terminal cleavage/methylation domain-containing protein n=1 Tax=Vibrio amylolyticus TaxID=2847292 RepID=A0A9X1XJV3_9VIBR|nr:prepilin-type N-terminal cleavage/methylation domain-containing protein [Vibrio amylolyticus]MCK6262270.1 prepilin-type N-terminal cleavage/methylation domain-containing protein [Vibrio amylolyticus]
MKRNGFTLIEMIMTIIIGGILVLGIAGFLELGMKGYSDTAERQRLQTQARFVLEKISREIRHSVPNSIEVTGSTDKCVSFYPILYSGFYSVSSADNLSLSFLVGNDNSPATYDGLNMIINPSQQDDFTDSDIFIALSGASTSITLAQPLASESIANRHYIYKDLVSYCFNSSSKAIVRNSTQVADSVTNGDISYDAPTLQRGGVVHIDVTFESDDESTSFQQDIQVLNVP